MKKYQKIIPTIDIMDGKVVRLTKFDFNQKTEYEGDILHYVEKFSHFKRIHIVDLDGVRTGTPQIYDIIKGIREKYPKLEIEVGGGIRTHHDVKRYFELDCYIIVKTLLDSDDVEFLRPYRNRLIYGCDIEMNEFINIKTINKISKIGIKNINITFKDLDGTLDGYEKHHNHILLIKSSIRFLSNMNISIGGGVSSNSDIQFIIDNEMDCIVGKYLYNIDNGFNNIKILEY